MFHYSDNKASTGVGSYNYAKVIITLFLIFAFFSLSFPLVLPIGPTYWDLYIYYDAIGRMNFGQIPSVDFMTPAGPLEYLLPWMLSDVFPSANPVLLTQWSWVPITAPALLLILSDAKRFGSGVVWGLALPWIFMTALPFNPGADPYTGVHAFGIYNRHGAHLMFLTIATVLFVRAPIRQTALLSVLLLSLAFCKITAFVAVGPLLFLGVITERIRIKVALATAAICLCFVLIAELITGVVSAYLLDIAELASLNTGGVAQRFLRAGEYYPEMLLAGGALCVLLAVKSSRPVNETGKFSFSAWSDQAWVWIATAIFCGLFFETQNTGSHPYTVVVPTLLLLLLKPEELKAPIRLPVLLLCAVMFAPITVDIFRTAAGTVVRFADFEPLEAKNLGVLGQVSSKPSTKSRADVMRTAYIEKRPGLENLAETGELLSEKIFAEPSFQFLYLSELAKTATAVAAWEDIIGKRFNSVITIDFTSPAAFVMGKDAPRHLAIGAAPGRSVPPLSDDMKAAISETDLVLEPKCPVEAQQKMLFKHFEPALKGRQRYALTPCYDVLVGPGVPPPQE